MLVNYQGLNTQIKKKLYPVYIIIGQDPYLQNDCFQKIKSSWQAQGAVETEVIEVDNNWGNAFDLANNYGLFSELTCLDIRFNKKSFNKNFKEVISNYLNHYNPKSLIIIKAPNITSKQLQPIADNPNLQIVNAKQLNAIELQKWIRQELTNANIQTESDVADIIYQFSQNNMLAARQTIAKLNLINSENKVFTSTEILKFINNQSEYPVYELTSACLLANSSQAISILRKFSTNNQTNNIYILWLLSHEVRQLMRLKNMLGQATSLQIACKKLKIWPQKIKMYEAACNRFNYEQLSGLIKYCAQLDVMMKTSSDKNIWDKLEQLTLLICLGWK